MSFTVWIRFQEARSRRQCDILEARSVQAERRLEEHEELLSQLEEKLVRAELRHIAHMSVQVRLEDRRSHQRDVR